MGELEDDTGSQYLGGRAILLVEDNNDLRGALSETLQLIGHTVYEASSGREALTVAGQRQEEIGLVISDLVMPGMNALELYEALEFTRRGGKMLIITGYPMPHTGESIAHRQGVRWATKPIRIEELQDLIGQMLRE